MDLCVHRKPSHCACSCPQTSPPTPPPPSPQAPPLRVLFSANTPPPPPHFLFSFFPLCRRTSDYASGELRSLWCDTHTHTHTRPPLLSSVAEREDCGCIRGPEESHLHHSLNPHHLHCPQELTDMVSHGQKSFGMLGMRERDDDLTKLSFSLRVWLVRLTKVNKTFATDFSDLLLLVRIS